VVFSRTAATGLVVSCPPPPYLWGSNLRGSGYDRLSPTGLFGRIRGWVNSLPSNRQARANSPLLLTGLYVYYEAALGQRAAWMVETCPISELLDGNREVTLDYLFRLTWSLTNKGLEQGPFQHNRPTPSSPEWASRSSADTLWWR
jgi:hypothetical protein